MTLRTAELLWGEEVVRLALAEPAPEPPTEALSAEVERHADPPGAFRAWALSQPWPRFCTIVRIVSGAYRRELLGDEDDGEG